MLDCSCNFSDELLILHRCSSVSALDAALQYLISTDALPSLAGHARAASALGMINRFYL